METQKTCYGVRYQTNEKHCRAKFLQEKNRKIFQNIIESGGGISSLSVGDGETQIRSYPQSFGEYRTGGWEIIKSFESLLIC